MIDSSLAMMICGAGTTFFLIHSERGRPIRNVLFKVEYFERMFACSFCTGYWVGLLIALVHPGMWTGYTILEVTGMMAGAVMMGMGTGIMSILIDRLIDLGDASVHAASMMQSNMPDEIHYMDVPEEDDDTIASDNESTDETVYNRQVK